MGPVAAPSTLPGVLERTAARLPGMPAIIEDTGATTCRGLLTAASGLVSLGVEAGERVGVWLPNGTEWAIAAYGALCAGAVVVPINTRYTVAEAADLITRAGCSVVLAHGRFLGRDLGLEASRAGAHAAVGVARLGEAASAEGDREAERRMRALTPEDASHVQYTSGTTGRPKGAMLRHGSLVSTPGPAVGAGGPLGVHRLRADRGGRGRHDDPGGCPPLISDQRLHLVYKIRFQGRCGP